MRNKTVAVLLFMFMSGFSYAKELTMAQIHLGHVYKSWSTTPNQEGFLDVAVAEATIARDNIEMAVSSNDLAQSKRYLQNTLHALTGEGSGAGLGYGLKKANKGVRKHARLAAQSPGASDAIEKYADSVAIQTDRIASRIEQILVIGSIASEETDQATYNSLVKKIAAQFQEIYSPSQPNSGLSVLTDLTIDVRRSEGLL